MKPHLTDEEKYELLWALFQAPKGRGLRLSRALADLLALDSSHSDFRRLKDQAESFLREYNHQYGGQVVFYDRDGKERDIEDPQEKGRVRRYRLLQEPKLLDPRSLRFHLLLVDRFNHFFLPAFEQRALHERIGAGPTARQSALVDKLEFAPRYPGIFPNVCQQEYRRVEAVALRALEAGRGFSAHYAGGELKVYFPAKLLRREQVSYLTCCDDSDIQQYEEMALHRFSLEFSHTGSAASYPLVEAPADLRHDRMQVKARVAGRWGMLELLELVVEGPVAIHLAQMRFHREEEDAHLTSHHWLTKSPEPRLELSIGKIFYDYELKTWLLGLGSSLKSVRAVALNPDEGIDPRRDLLEELERVQCNLRVETNLPGSSLGDK